MKIAVVDSHKEFLEIISQIFKKIENFEIFCYSNVEELDNTLYEFVLLDIDMPDFDGIQYSRNHLERNFIFLSNQKDKMQDSFGPNIYGFINKADSFDKFKTIIEDVILRITKYNKIMLKTNQGQQIFKISEILYLQYLDCRTIGLVYACKQYLVYGYSLKSIEEKLGENFIYLDRGTMVNMDKVVSITKNEISLQGIIQVFEISNRRLKYVKEKLRSF